MKRLRSNWRTWAGWAAWLAYVAALYLMARFYWHVYTVFLFMGALVVMTLAMAIGFKYLRRGGPGGQS
jgi:hypothetical protein